MNKNKEAIEKIDNEIDSLYKKIGDLQKQKTDLEYAEFPDLINKFWKIKHWDHLYYMHVFEFFRHGTDKYIIRGHGFRSEFTPFWDACFMTWDRGEDITIRQQDIKRYMRENIQEITKEEFTEKFNEMLDTCKEYFNKIKEIDYSKKDE